MLTVPLASSAQASVCFIQLVSSRSAKSSRAWAPRLSLRSSAVTAVADDTVLINQDWIDAAAFAHLDRIDVDPSEPHAANALWVGGTVVYPSAYSRTRKRLEDRGRVVEAVDVSPLDRVQLETALPRAADGVG